jgi:hypothetical protein
LYSHAPTSAAAIISISPAAIPIAISRRGLGVPAKKASLGAAEQRTVKRVAREGLKRDKQDAKQERSGRVL